MTDITERLLNISRGDHERGCTGREYTCSCEYDNENWKTAEQAVTEIKTLRSSLKEIREENDRLKGERDEAQSDHLKALAELAEAKATCEAMAKALEPFAAWNSSDEYIKSDAPDDGRCAGHSYTAGDYRIARAALDAYRKEKTV